MENAPDTFFINELHWGGFERLPSSAHACHVNQLARSTTGVVTTVVTGKSHSHRQSPASHRQVGKQAVIDLRLSQQWP